MEKLNLIHNYIQKQITESVNFETEISVDKHKKILQEIDKMLLYYMKKTSGIENLDLSARQFCSLKRAGIYTIIQLNAQTRTSLLEIKNLSEKDIDDLFQKGYISI